MAVSGADWRNPADAYRTDGLYGARTVRPAIGWEPAASAHGGVNTARTLADNTDSDGCLAVRNTVTTDDRPNPASLAIENATGTPIVTGWPDNGAGIFLRHLPPRPRTRRRAVIVK